ncbi:MAG: rod shape-determining protein [Planctomycetota bacterium]|nr:MAG: rod shape-determining protein [Planctomycetota bacterium]
MFWNKLWGRFSTDMGIDLGTANTLVYVRGEGVVLREPSVVAVRRDTQEVLMEGEAVGHLAKEMLGKAPSKVEVVRPLREGVISDYDVAEMMLRYFIRKVHNQRMFVRPLVVIAVPYNIPQVGRKAVYTSAQKAGARQVYLIEECLAAGIGAGLKIEEPSANMIVDIGGGTTEIAILSLTDIVIADSVKIGGDEMDKAIRDYVRQRHQLVVGEQTTERIKLRLGSAMELEQELSMLVRGKGLDGRPASVELHSQEVREAIVPCLEKIGQAIEGVLEKASAELAADLAEKGITLSGGGALLPKIDAFFASRLGLEVRVAEDPLTCVVRGTGVFLENLDFYASLLEDMEEAA